jgi:hypothetical protein
MNQKTRTIVLKISLMAVTLLTLPLLLRGAPSKSRDEIAQWSNAGFADPKITVIETKKFYRGGTYRFSHSFDLTLVMFRKTGWSKSSIVKRIKKAALIYARHGIRIQTLRLVVADAPSGIIDFWQPGGEDFEIARLTPIQERPVLYYIRAVPKLNAYSWLETKASHPVPKPLRHTVWISLASDMPLNKRRYRSSYTTEAHELGHVFLNSPEHTAPGILNLMSEAPETADDSLTPKQIATIKQHPLMKKLPERDR